MFESHINLYVRFCAGLIVEQTFYEDVEQTLDEFFNVIARIGPFFTPQI